MLVKSIKYNLGGFIEDLAYALVEDTESIDDVVQGYKTFIKRVNEPLLSAIKKYVNAHPLVVDNERIKSFIDVCYT